MKNEFKFVFNLAAKGQYTLYTALIEKFSYLILFIILARVSTTSGYGQITAIFAFSNILASFLNLGLGLNIQKEISAGSEDVKEIFYNTITIKVILFLVFAAGSFFYIFYQLNADPVFVMIPIAIYLAVFQDILNLGMYGLGKFKEAFKALLISRMLLLFVITVFYFTGMDEVYVIGGYFVGILFYQVVLTKSFVRASSIPVKPGFSFDKKLVRNIIFSSVPMGAGIFAVLVYDKADVVIIQSFLGNQDVAFYAIAYSIYKLPAIVPGIFLVPLFSSIVSKYHKGEMINVKSIMFIGLLMLLAALILGIIIFVLGDKFILLLFGDKFSNSSVYLNLLIFALPGLFLNNLTGTLLNAINLQKKQAIGTIAGVIFNLLLIFVLIDRYDVWAAVISTVLSEYLVFFIQLFYIYRNKKVFHIGHL